MKSLVTVRTFCFFPINDEVGIGGQWPVILETYLKSLIHRGQELGGYNLHVTQYHIKYKMK